MKLDASISATFEEQFGDLEKTASDYYTLFDPSTGMVKRLGPRLCDPRSLLPLPSGRGEFTQTRAHHFGQLYTSYQVQG